MTGVPVKYLPELTTQETSTKFLEFTMWIFQRHELLIDVNDYFDCFVLW
jgi:hypothetical protein